ncbi:MAG: DUF560 domain-containing protein [Alphaproteobacteria bacterium]|nr:DUF560 domain-containing protein [Alphaproteobacteria bacterium]MBV9372644.1 DUF560 domain-containing protein [Alphaproteobacteria bacterium]MBV9900151.1 DUF560 domain-containing protein [Alphaproteobacteria bacterium]
MRRREAAFALLPLVLAAATAAAAPGGQILPYDLAGVMGAASASLVQPVEPGEQYPPTLQDRTLPTLPREAQPAPPRPAGGPRLSLTLDASITGDSNVTNATDRTSVAVDYGGGPLPVPLDPSLREKAGIGIGLSGSAGLKLPVAEGVSLAMGAEAYMVEYQGRRGDDASLLGAGGIELSSGSGAGSLQLIAFDRWYGGAEAMKGYGVRANWREEVAKGRHVSLYLDARQFDSGYGRAFGGRQAGAWLSYDAVLDPTLTAAGGVYVRRDRLRDDAFASTEFGAYGNLTHYLSGDLTGGLGAGISRARFDAPVPFLSAEARRDWRYYGTVWITTRRPLAWGVFPSLTYTYSRTSSSVGFYDADRHRLRLGFSRSF